MALPRSRTASLFCRDSCECEPHQVGFRQGTSMIEAPFIEQLGADAMAFGKVSLGLST